MKRLPFILLFLTAMILGIATFVEDRRGMDFIHATVYGAVWFKVLWGTVAASALWRMWKAKMYRRVAVFMLHISLLLILAGGLVTALTHQGGKLHLRQGLTEAQFVTDGHRLAALPFTICLDTFYVQYYPGTETPQDYVSMVSISGKDRSRATAQVSMNHILRQDGYRIYQNSYDMDGLGSWLTVTYDPYGSAIAYIGFLLFGLSGIGVLLGRQNGFRQLLSKFRTYGIMPVLLFILPLSLQAKDPSPTISRASADSLATRLVVWNGRVCPFNTLATDFVTKIYGKRRCQGYSPEQVVASWARYPDSWNRAPLIEVKHAELRQRLGIDGTRCSYASLFDADGSYRLQPLWEAVADKRGKLAQAIRQTDEKAALIAMLLNGTLIREVGDRGDVSAAEPPSTGRMGKAGEMRESEGKADEMSAREGRPGEMSAREGRPGEMSAREGKAGEMGVGMPSEMRVRAELLYNRVPFVSILFMVNLGLGLLCFIMLSIPRLRGGLTSNWLRLLLVLSLLTLLFAYVLRWYVSGRVPLANGFETMMFAALAIQAIALVLCRQQPLVIPFGFLLSGFLLLVAHLGVMSPQITNLMPVLQSPWLSSHVSIIMIAYALLGFTFFSSLFYFIIPRRENRRAQDGLNEGTRRENRRAQDGASSLMEGGEDRASLTLLSRLLLYPAVFLLFVGIFLGAIWANVSWGAYWSWDPKEVWALVTAIVYAIPLHGSSLAWVRNDRAFNLYLIFAFLTVLMTYFGVNFLLGGMHSYAN